MKTFATILVTLLCVAVMAWAGLHLWQRGYDKGVAAHAAWVVSVCQGGKTFAMPDGYAYRCDRQLKL